MNIIGVKVISGTIHASFQTRDVDKNYSVYSRSIDGGASWMPFCAMADTSTTPRYAAGSPIVAQTGDVFAFSSSLSPFETTIECSRFIEPSSPFEHVGQVVESSWVPLLISGAVAPDGTLYCYFGRKTKDLIRIEHFLAASSDGGATWSSPRQIGDVLSSDRYPLGAITVCPDGTVAVLVPDRDNVVRLFESSNDGESWSELVIDDTFVPGAPFLHCRTDGALGLTYYRSFVDEPGTEVVFAERAESGDLSELVVVPGPDGAFGHLQLASRGSDWEIATLWNVPFSTTSTLMSTKQQQDGSWLPFCGIVEAKPPYYGLVLSEGGTRTYLWAVESERGHDTKVWGEFTVPVIGTGWTGLKSRY